MKKIFLVYGDPSAHLLASELVRNLKAKEPDIKIEHIGSTSIEELVAKPIIDIMIGLKDFSTANNHISTMEALGYKYVTKYESIIPGDKYFTKDLNGKRTYHVHMVGFETKLWNRHLMFRNQLRNNPVDRKKYLELKKDLAKREWSCGFEYAEAKSEFITGILDKISKRK